MTHEPVTSHLFRGDGKFNHRGLICKLSIAMHGKENKTKIPHLSSHLSRISNVFVVLYAMLVLNPTGLPRDHHWFVHFRCYLLIWVNPCPQASPAVHPDWAKTIYREGIKGRNIHVTMIAATVSEPELEASERGSILIGVTQQARSQDFSWGVRVSSEFANF